MGFIFSMYIYCNQHEIYSCVNMALFIVLLVSVEWLICIFAAHHCKNHTAEETLHFLVFTLYGHYFAASFQVHFLLFHKILLIRVFTSSTQLGINESGPFDLVWIIKGRWRLAYVLYRSLPRLIPLSLPFELAGRVHGSGSEGLSVCRAAFLLSSGFVAGDNWEMSEVCQIKFLGTIGHG